MGGTATEREGPWGTELVVSLTVDLPDGQRAQQASEVIGIPGPRWLLRATLFGRPAVEHRRRTATSRPRCATSSWSAAARRSRPATRCR